MKRPSVLMALFCEEARLDDQYRLWIREAFSMSVATPVTSGGPGISAKVNFSARIIGGGVSGAHKVTLKCESALVDLSWDVTFQGEAEDMPTDILNWPVELRILREGLHWFDLAVNGEVLTQIPLRVLKASSLLGM